VKSYWQQLFNIGRKSTFDPDNCNQYKTGFSKMAYGVKDVMASPMVMSRLAGAIMNDGLLKASRFIHTSDRAIPAVDPDVNITSPEAAAILRDFMYNQKATKKLRGRLETAKKDYGTLYGKTGTPSREIQEHGGSRPSSDGWYVFSVANAQNVPLVIAIRVERIGNADSGEAVGVAEKVVLPVLELCNYIQSK
jgi:cell division protein FtsI/penicillin-binding protein 2